MTLRVKVNFKVSCPKHRGYDPSADGEGGIKAGCSVCRQLFELHQQASKFLGFAGIVALATRERTKTKAARA